MILRELARGRGRDSAHRDVDAAGRQAMRDGIDADHDRLERRIIGEHRDDDAARRCDRRAIRHQLGAALDQRVRLRCGAIVDAKLVTGGEQVGRHRQSHRTESDKSDFHVQDPPGSSRRIDAIANARRRSSGIQIRSDIASTTATLVGKASDRTPPASYCTRSSGGAAELRARPFRFCRASDATRPHRFEMRWTCVSTQMPGLPNASVTTRLAVLRPTPLSVSSSSIVGHLTAEFFDQVAADLANDARLGAVEADRIDQPRDFVAATQHRRRCVGAGEQARAATAVVWSLVRRLRMHPMRVRKGS